MTGRILSKHHVLKTVVLSAILWFSSNYLYSQETPSLWTPCETGLQCSPDTVTGGEAITLPGYPNCWMDVVYRRISCGDNAVIYIIDHILINVPNQADSGDPCWELWFDPSSPYSDNNPANFTPTGTARRKLYQDALKAFALKYFNSHYIVDSTFSAANPSDNVLRQKYLDYICPTGKKILRGVHASCMITATKCVHKYGNEGNRKSGAQLMYDSVYHDCYLRIRYLPCQPYTMVCCVRQFTMCRDTVHGTTITQDSGWQTAQPECPDTVNAGLYNLLPGEQLGSQCLHYCNEGTNPPQNRKGDDPKELPPNSQRKKQPPMIGSRQWRKQ